MNFQIIFILEFKENLDKKNLYYIIFNLYLDSILIKHYLIKNNLSEIENLLQIKGKNNFLQKQEIFTYLLRDEDKFKLVNFNIIKKKKFRNQNNFFPRIF